MIFFLLGAQPIFLNFNMPMSFHNLHKSISIIAARIIANQPPSVHIPDFVTLIFNTKKFQGNVVVDTALKGKNNCYSTVYSRCWPLTKDMSYINFKPIVQEQALLNREIYEDNNTFEFYEVMNTKYSIPLKTDGSWNICRWNSHTGIVIAVRKKSVVDEMVRPKGGSRFVGEMFG